MQVVLLPDEVLQDIGVIGHAVKDVGGVSPNPSSWRRKSAVAMRALLIPRVRWCHFQRILTIMDPQKPCHFNLLAAKPLSASGPGTPTAAPA